MTRTGLSCEHLKQKLKHGCRLLTECYCSESGCYVDPLSCSRGCDMFTGRLDAIMSAIPRRQPKLADELL